MAREDSLMSSFAGKDILINLFIFQKIFVPDQFFQSPYRGYILHMVFLQRTPLWRVSFLNKNVIMFAFWTHFLAKHCM